MINYSLGILVGGIFPKNNTENGIQTNKSGEQNVDKEQRRQIFCYGKLKFERLLTKI